MRTAVLSALLVVAGLVAFIFMTQDERLAKREAAASPQRVEPAPAQKRGLPQSSVLDPKEEKRLTTLGMAFPGMPEVGEALPLVGPKKKDKWGYPLQKPDKIALRALAIEGRFDELEAHFAAYQKKFASNPKYEFWPIMACEAFNDAHSELGAAVSAYVEAKPESPWAACAEAEFLEAKAWATRGGDVVSKTSERELEGFAKGLVPVDAALERALELEPKHIAAARARIVVARDRSMPPEELDARAEAALKICPACVSPHAAYLEALRTRWRGSYEEQDAYAKRAQKRARKNPRLKTLLSFSKSDRCADLLTAEKYAPAIAACTEANADGAHESQFIDALRRAEKYQQAAERARKRLETHPQDVDALRAIAFAHWDDKNWLEEAKTWLTIRQLDATDAGARNRVAQVIGYLTQIIDADIKAEAFDDAREHVQLCVDLHPDHPHCWQQLAPLLAREGIEPIREAADANPDDFDAQRRLDAVLSQQNAYPEIEQRWTAFIERNPDHARAYYERGGTRQRLGDKGGSLADVRKACNLGHLLACARAKQMAG